MNIGIDFDGVILDSEVHLKFLADYWSYFSLGKERQKVDEVTQEFCFDWTKDEIDEYYNTQFHEATKRAGFVAGAKDILEKLKADGHKLFVISKRGYYNEKELEFALPKLDEFGFEFDGVFFSIRDKIAKCNELNIDIMIEDNPENSEQFLNSNIKVIYLRAKNIRKLKHKNIKEADTWLDIYKAIKTTK